MRDNEDEFGLKLCGSVDVDDRGESGRLLSMSEMSSAEGSEPFGGNCISKLRPEALCFSDKYQY